MWVMVDVETDGPAPGRFSMISLGAVIVDEKLDKTFYKTFRPISDEFIPEALNVSGFTREETLEFENPIGSIISFKEWLDYHSQDFKSKRPYFISDNNGFDWQFVNYYFWKYLNANPFGHSSTNLGSLYKGCERTMFKNFKHLRKTKHTHNPVDDAKGNAEALLQIKELYDLKINFE